MRLLGQPSPAWLVVLALLWGSGAIALSAAAQEAPEDPPEGSNPLLDLLETAKDSTAVAAAADSLAAAEEAEPLPVLPPWYAPLVPVVDGRVESSVARVVISGGIEAPVGDFVGLGGSMRYSRTNTRYRQFEREADVSRLQLLLNGPVRDWAELDIAIDRDRSTDENRVGLEPIVLEYDQRELRASLVGDRELGRGMRFHWGVRGDAEDVQRTDKGIANDRALLGGAAGTAWGTRGPWHDFTARYGYDRKTGERTLRDQTADAVTERDTLWVRGSLGDSPRFDLNLDLRRTTLVEDRLDFARNVNGVVDTLNVPDPVGEEHESTWQNRWDADLRTRPLPRLAVNAGATRTYSESDHTFSREGLVVLGNERVDGEVVLRYAAAGSLKVRGSWEDRYNDRRPRGQLEFRGEESRVSKRAEAQFRQQVTRLVELHLDLQQTLDQNIYEEAGNDNDRDRLLTRSDLKLLSDPWEWMQVEVAGAYSEEQSIALDADRAQNNQTSDLYEVRSNVIVDPEGGWRFIQNFRMQIRVIDVVDGIDNDRFNKQGQWDNRVEYRFASGVFLDGQYIVDYRRNGARDPDRPDEEAYIYGGARRDHRVVAGVRIPVYGFEFETRTERGFLRDQSGFTERNEDRGEISAGVRGNWQFWNQRGKLTLNASRVLQFGPRVREEEEDYWVINTSLRVAF